jgi:hypothetical protein
MDAELRRFILAVAITGAVLALAMLGISGVHAGFSTAMGAGVACANLYVMGRAVAAMLGPSGGRGWKLVGALKMLALFAGVWLLLTKGVVDPIPLVVGLCALPLGLAIGSILANSRGKEAPEKDTDA